MALRSQAPSHSLAPPSSSVDLPSTEPSDNPKVKNEKPASDTETGMIIIVSVKLF